MRKNAPAPIPFKSFTVFAEGDLEFGKQLNVIVGENGLGKTHILKAAYCVLAVSARGAKDSGNTTPTKSYLQTAIASKLPGVFRPDELGRLVRRQAGRNRCEVTCHFDNPGNDLGFSLNTASKSEVMIDQAPAAWIEDTPIYLPTRELLTIYPGFVSLYETTHLEFEETWRDMAILLGAPLARGPRERRIRELLKPLESALDGTVEMDDSGRFYVRMDTGRFEIHLVAEGLRKVATIARLIATGSLLDKGCLFWDEPDANLNPTAARGVSRDRHALLRVAPRRRRRRKRPARQDSGRHRRHCGTGRGVGPIGTLHRGRKPDDRESGLK